MAKFIYSFGIILLGLSLGMANSCWFFTTALLVIVLPVLLYIINLI